MTRRREERGEKRIKTLVNALRVLSDDFASLAKWFSRAALTAPQMKFSPSNNPWHRVLTPRSRPNRPPSLGVNSLIEIDGRRHTFLDRDRIPPRLPTRRRHLEGVGTWGDLIHKRVAAIDRDVGDATAPTAHVLLTVGLDQGRGCMEVTADALNR